MAFWEWLDHIDKIFFTFIHAKASAPWLDWLMLLLRNENTWIPLYAFLLYWLLRNQLKYSWQFILLSLICFAITNHLAVEVIKPYFHRLRPCHDETLQPIIRGIIDCGGKFSLPSAHAANHFGLATFWFFSITLISGQKWNLLWVWALLVCYAQVYVGKHYPLDVILGASVGIVTGLIIYKLFGMLTKKLRKLF